MIASSTKHQDRREEWVAPRSIDMVWAIMLAGGMFVFSVVCLLLPLCRDSVGCLIQTAPAPDPKSSVPAPPGAAPDPKQQYSTVTVTAIPVGPPNPVGGAQYPTSGAQYPTSGAPYPTNGTPYPVSGPPYPTSGAQYPTSGAPYPNNGTPYPVSGPPYVTSGAQYPGPGAPYPTAAAGAHASTVPSAPEHHELPPSYDQVMSTGAEHPPYNPYVPH